MARVPTPEATTLSDESDTERLDTSDMPRPQCMLPPRAIYLIVATAHPTMGIGLKGTLPWPSLKKDMSFFRSVTSKPPLQPSGREGLMRRNAVVMGRKTWESIPKKYRPLEGRINVVLTRDAKGFTEGSDGREGGQVVQAVGSLSEAMDMLEGRDLYVGKVFVIGGSEVYREACEWKGQGEWGGVRILQTQVRRRDGEEIKCDTFFPLGLGEEEVRGWRKVEAKEVKEWADSKPVPGLDGDWVEDGDMEIRVVGWEKETER